MCHNVLGTSWLFDKYEALPAQLEFDGIHMKLKTSLFRLNCNVIWFCAPCWNYLEGPAKTQEGAMQMSGNTVPGCSRTMQWREILNDCRKDDV